MVDLDIGCGANLIYPLLSSAQGTWLNANLCSVLSIGPLHSVW